MMLLLTECLTLFPSAKQGAIRSLFETHLAGWTFADHGMHSTSLHAGVMHQDSWAQIWSRRQAKHHQVLVHQTSAGPSLGMPCYERIEGGHQTNNSILLKDWMTATRKVA